MTAPTERERIAGRTSTFVVREEPTGEWVMGCCDDLHGWIPVFANYPTKRAAERAATQHRADDKTQKMFQAARDAHLCPTCGQERPR